MFCNTEFGCVKCFKIYIKDDLGKYYKVEILLKLLLALGRRDNYLRKINNNKNVPVKNGPFLTGCEFAFLSQFTFIVSCIFAFPFGKE